MYACGKKNLCGGKGCKQQFTPPVSPMCVVGKYSSKMDSLPSIYLFEVQSLCL